MFSLPDVWIRPNFGGKGRKMTGQLQAHSNGFRYSTPKQERLDIMYRSAPPSLAFCKSSSLCWALRRTFIACSLLHL